MYWSNSERAKKLGNLWAKLWLFGYREYGISSDQPSFNTAVQRLKPGFQLLDPKYNTQLWVNQMQCADSYIWHYGGEAMKTVSSMTDYPESCFSNAAGASIDEVRLLGKKSANAKSPWLMSDTEIHGKIRISDLSKSSRVKHLVGQAYAALDHGNYVHSLKLAAIGWNTNRASGQAFATVGKFFLVFSFRLLRAFMRKS